VEYVVTKTIDQEGKVTYEKAIKKTYTQNWKVYNLSQQVEKGKVMELLADITKRISQPAYRFGRPTIGLGDMIYSMVFKTYSTFSGRRFTSDMVIAKEKGYLTDQPHYNSLFNYFANPKLTELLCQIVTITSLPLRTVETDFAIDSTGFGTSNFQRWYSFKYGREISSRRWVKAHFVTGVRTNTITSVKITSEFDNDCPQLPELVQATAQHFDMKELSADKAYLSKENLQVAQDVGATPFIPFKSNSQPNGNGMLWKKLYYYFQMNNENFLQYYHKRSNVESTVFMVKAKFGDSVRSKTWTALEVLTGQSQWCSIHNRRPSIS
jgi:transposase